MAGVWAIMTALTVFFGLPGILGTLLAGEYGSRRLLNIWVTFMAVSLAVELAVTVVMMAIT